MFNAVALVIRSPVRGARERVSAVGVGAGTALGVRETTGVCDLTGTRLCPGVGGIRTQT